MAKLGLGWATILVAAPFLWAGCVSDPGPKADPPAPVDDDFVPATPFWLDDVQGDEESFAISTLSYGPPCRIGCQPLPAGVPNTGDAAPYFDITRVGMASEARPAFEIAIETAGLTEGFEALDENGAVHRIAVYEACWEPGEGYSTRCVILVAAPAKNGAVLLSTFNIRGLAACGDLWLECAWDVPAELTYGTPGKIQFTIPKEYAAWGGAPLAIENLRASVQWFSANKAIPLWHFAWTVRLPDDHQHDHQGLPEASGVADATAILAEHVELSHGVEPVPVDPATPIMTPGEGNLFGAGGIRDYTDLDLVRLDLREEGDQLVVTFGMASLPEMPNYDLQLALLMELSDGHDWELGVMQSNSVSYGYAGRCISFGCHEAFLDQEPLEIVDDSFIIRVPLETIGNPAEGVQTTWLLAYTMYGEFNQDVGPGGQDGSVNLHSGSIIDSHVGGRPFVFSGYGEPVDHAHEH